MEILVSPLVSVVMPVYNVAHYVGEAIRSILTQTYPHFEFIIVDDGSTDASAGVVRDFAAHDARIRYIQIAHGGAYRARNIGIAAAQGEFIAHMDADDIALPQRFDSQLAWMRETGVEVCGSCAKAFGDQDQVYWFPETHVAICHDFVLRMPFLHPTMILRAEVARANPYDGTLLTGGDFELLTRLALHHRLGNIPQVLHLWRSHARQTHVVLYNTALEMVRINRRRYLAALFPEAMPTDYDILMCLADREALVDITALERAGTWLARLAHTPDHFLRRRLADRWHAECLKAASLGLSVYRLYHEVAPRFAVAPAANTQKLWLMCALRLRSDSGLGAWIWRARGQTGSGRQRRLAKAK